MPNAGGEFVAAKPMRFSYLFTAATAAFLVSFGSPGLAQEAQDDETVLLTSRDGTISIEGKFVAFENGVYIIETPRLGIMRIDSKRVNCAGAPCLIALEAATAQEEPATTDTTAAETTATDTATTDTATTDTATTEPVTPDPVAEASTEAAVVEPAAAETPPPTATLEFSFGIHGSRTVGTTLIPTLLGGYAEHVGASLDIVATDDAAVRVARLTNADGSLRAVIDLQSKGSGSAVPALIDGVADIGVTDRPMNAGDIEKLTAAGLPDLRNTANELVLGLDGIVVILNKANPVGDLSPEEVSKIFAGEITNWSELGGDNVPISIQSFNEGSGDREVLLNGLVRPFGREETAPVTRWEAYQDMVDQVMAEPGAIGYVGRWLARSNDVKTMPIREVCGIMSEPSDFRMKIEGYSLSRRLYAFKLPGDIHPEARAFLDWTQTRDAQAYIKEANFVDRELERVFLADVDSARADWAEAQPDFNQRQYSDMVDELGKAERLSLSFRFQFGSSKLDSEAVKTVEQLGRLIESGDFKGKDILLVGFADAIGGRTRNTRLAKARAEEVRSILQDFLPPEVANEAALIPLSFGELMPLSCNDDDVGRERNRRVEVWLRAG
jgi:phosphate transport system substrate-binding protein